MKFFKVSTIVLILLLTPLIPFSVMGEPYRISIDNRNNIVREISLIHDVFELQGMRNDLAGDYVLANDIDASITKQWNGGKGFEPIGSFHDPGNPFIGTFDGKGFTISNLFINRSMGNLGLFEYANSTISNVVLRDVDIIGHSHNIGGLVGYNLGKITNCSVTGSIQCGGSYNNIGGLVGYTENSIINCSAYVNISGSVYVGGLIGRIGQYGDVAPIVVDNCYSAGQVYSSGQYTGGLIGAQYNGIITLSYSSCDVKGEGNYVGGLVGYGNGTSNSYSTGTVNGRGYVGGLAGYIRGGNVSNCYSTGMVCGTNWCVGGLVGEMAGGPFCATIANCYSTGSVNGSDRVGGLIGYSYVSPFGPNDTLTVLNCFSTGQVSGTSDIGGLIGINLNSTVLYCYWDGQTSGLSISAGGIGLETMKMFHNSAFLGWDFINNWGIIEDKTYPFLLWRYPSAILVSGKVFPDEGMTTVGYGYQIQVIDHFGLSIAHFESVTDSSGRYVQLADNGSILIYVKNSILNGNSLFHDANQDLSGLDIHGDLILAICNYDKYIQLNDFLTLQKKYLAGNLLFNSWHNSFDIYTDVSFKSMPGSDINLEMDIIASGESSITFGGRVFLSVDINISTPVITFKENLESFNNLTLNCTGDIIFNSSVNLGKLDITFVDNLVINGLMRLMEFNQIGGKGTTNFHDGIIDAGFGMVSIRTSMAIGKVIAGNLSIGTTYANLTGYVNGKSGEAGAKEIVLLRNIRMGTNYFDGFDIYRFTPEDVTVCFEDVPYLVNYNGLDPKNETLTWILFTNAKWLSMGVLTGVLSGTPGNDDVGLYDVEITVYDGARKNMRTFSLEVLNVNDAPEILTRDVVSINEDEIYNVNYTAIDIDPTHDILTWILKSNASWLYMTGSHLWGIPNNDDVGLYWVNITVTDGNGGIAAREFNLTVINTNDAPLITVKPIEIAIEDELYSMAFNATDVDMDDSLNWIVETSANWLKIDSQTGFLSGIPSNGDVGSYLVTVIVIDDDGASNNVSFILTVANTNDKPSWISIPGDLNLIEGDEFLINISASDVDLGDEITYSLFTVPISDLSIDQTTGTIYWEHARFGVFNVTIIVNDSKSPINHTFIIRVIKNNPPMINSKLTYTVKVGELLDVKLNGTDADSWDAKNLTFDLKSSLIGMIITPEGRLIWIPTKNQIGVHKVNISISDGKNITTMEFSITVKNIDSNRDNLPGIYSQVWLIGMLIIGIFIGCMIGFFINRIKKK